MFIVWGFGRLQKLSNMPCTRSDGALVVADANHVEKVLAPAGSGATVVYRLGYYNICLPKTLHSEE